MVEVISKTLEPFWEPKEDKHEKNTIFLGLGFNCQKPPD